MTSNGANNSKGNGNALPSLYPKPFSKETEMAVLSCMLQDPDSITKAASQLNFEGAFFIPAHQIIFDGIMELNAKGHRYIDTSLLLEQLSSRHKQEEFGGDSFLLDLYGYVPSAVYIDDYIKILREKALLRKTMDACSEAMRKCADGYEESEGEILTNLQQQIFDISNFRTTREFSDMSNVTLDALDKLEKLMKGERDVLGLPTGFDIDRYITGLKPGELFVLAARPSIGKTALMLNIVINVALKVNERHPVGIFSLEMPADSLAHRMLCAMTCVPMEAFKNGTATTADWARIGEAAELLQNSGIQVDDSGDMDIMELRAKARRMKTMHKIEAIFIDYLQLIRIRSKSNSNRENDVAMISASLKAMAKELNIPVVVLAQLNRQAEGNEIPKLCHLRESGAIEQDADIVALLHRERDKQYEQSLSDDKPLPATLIIAKNRNGATGKKDLMFFPKYTSFTNASPLESLEGVE